MTEYNHTRKAKIYLNLLTVTSSLVLGFGLWQTYKLGRDADLSQREALLVKASAIANTLSPEQITRLSFTAEDQASPVFQRLRSQMVTAAEHMGLDALYTITHRDGCFYFGPESLPANSPSASPPGTRYRQFPPEVADAFSSRLPRTTGLYTDEHGTFASAFVPVLEPRSGEVLAIVGLDVDSDTWRKRITHARQVPLISTLALLSALLLSHMILNIHKRLQTHMQWRMHYAEALLCALVMLTLTAAATWYINAAERQARLASFSSLAYSQASGIAKELWDIGEEFDTVRSFFQASDFVDRCEFHIFTERLIRDGATQGCVWLPAVPAQQVTQFEDEIRQQVGEKFTVWQFSEQGQPVPAAGRDTFYPALYIEPLAEREGSLGFDLGSEPVRRQAIEDAQRSGLATASDPVTLYAVTNTPFGLCVFQPVASVHQTGLFALTIHLESLIQTPMYKAGLQTSGLTTELFHLVSGQAPVVIASSDHIAHEEEPNCWSATDANLRIRFPIFCFGRTYAIVIHTTSEWLAEHPLHEGRAAAVAGILVTVLLTAFIALINNRRTALEREVQNRTTDLRTIHDNVRAVLNAAPVAMLVVDSETRIVDANLAAERLFNTALPDLLSRAFGDFVRCAQRHVDSRGCGYGPLCSDCVLRTSIRQVFDRCPSVHEQDIEVLLDRYGANEAVWLRFSVEPVIFNNCQHVVVALHDVTAWYRAEAEAKSAADETKRLLAEAEHAKIVLLRAVEDQKRADEALIHERNLLYALMDNLPDRIYFKDIESRFIKISKAHAAALGLVNPADAIGKRDADFKPDDHAARALATEKQIIATGQPLLAQVEQFQTPDGKVKWVSASKAPIRDKSGCVIGLVGISRDITQEIELQLQLQQASKMDAIGRLAGGVAHDFNNLLQAILGFTEILLADTGEIDSHYNDLKQIERAAKRAADLTRQLLAFSRKQRIEPQVIDINQLVTAMESMLRRLMGEDVTLDRVLAPDLKTVSADPSQIEQVIMNLAVNARDAMPQGGRMTFRTVNITLQAIDTLGIPESHPGTFVCLSVSDTGTGIPQDMLPRIFEPFFTTKVQGKGTGLGLAVIYGIVKQNGGWINVDSQEGQGSTFKVFLPAHDKGKEQEPPPVAEEDPVALQGLGKSILLVEDEPGVRRLATLLLQDAGYRVMACENALAAHAAFKREGGRFDLLFSDVVLPGQNGLELANDLRALHPGLPVLLCSGYADDRVRWKLIEQECYHFLPKPYPVALLLQTVRDALDQAPSPLS